MPLPSNSCVICGAGPVQGHHAAGRTYDEELVVDLCASHHQLIHDDLADAGCDLRHGQPWTRLEVIAHGLRCVGVLIARLADAWDADWLMGLSNYLIRMAEDIAKEVRAMDRHHPGWREACKGEGDA